MNARSRSALLAASLFGLACSSEPPAPSAGSGGAPAGTSGSAGSAPLGPAGAAGSGGSAPLASGGLGGSATTTGGAGGGNAGGVVGVGGASAGASAGGESGSSATGGAGGSGGGGGGASGGSGGAMALMPCAEPSVSRLKVWEMQVVGGSMTPASGSPLRTYAGGHELFVKFTIQAGGYGTANAPLNNRGQYTNGADPAQEAVDLSAAAGFTLEYATTGSGAYVQLRTGAVPHGGDHFRADMPNTSGQLQMLTLKFADFRRPGGNTPPAQDVLSDVFSFTFVAGSTTDLTLRQVLIPGFVPPCD